MTTHVLAVSGALVLFASAGGAQPVGGLYQILSGRYTECCGIGGPFVYLLPSSRQAFIQMAVDPGTESAQLRILGQDRSTVFQIPPFVTRPGFTYALSNGVVYPDRIEFGGLFAPPLALPGLSSFSFTVSNSLEGLRIHGTLNLACPMCADVPTQFKHTNVVAVRLPAAPVIEGIGRDGDLLRFRFTGEPPYDYFIEISDVLAPTNWLSLTNFRAKLEPIEAVVTDAITARPARFYRIRKQDCNCD